MITVNFYGRLKDDFGGRFVLDAASPREALHALFVQLDGLRAAVRPGFFKVRWNGKTVAETEAEAVFSEAGEGRLEITPVAAGAGKAGQIIGGIVLVVIGVIGNMYGGWGTPFISAGIGMIVGGVAQMLTKQPKLNTETSGTAAGRNSAFSNLDNTAAQGRPVPLAYGLVYCGSRVISQGVESRRIDVKDKASRDPQAAGLLLDKTFHGGTAAAAANGSLYRTDFADDSVRARNYTATVRE